MSIGDVASSALGALATGVGYLGAVCLFIGGLATFFPIPFIGQIGYMNGPTGSGFLFILCALLSIYIIYTSRFFLLYLTGGLAAIAAAFDIYSGTRLGYVAQMALGGGLTPSMGGAVDPVVSSMMQNAGFSIPTSWIILAAGIGILLITPNLAEQKPEEKQPVQKNRDQILENRMTELDNLITIYERGHINKEEFSQLKKEIMGKK
ncbi:MAG: hypothetical protein V1862_14055 [Methanobacteriota archaeon]